MLIFKEILFNGIKIECSFVMKFTTLIDDYWNKKGSSLFELNGDRVLKYDIFNNRCTLT